MALPSVGSTGLSGLKTLLVRCVRAARPQCGSGSVRGGDDLVALTFCRRAGRVCTLLFAPSEMILKFFLFVPNTCTRFSY